MIKLTSWPAEEGAPTPEIYINPDHITVLEAQERGTLIGILGQGVLRVGEGIEEVKKRLQNPGEWKA